MSEKKLEPYHNVKTKVSLNAKTGLLEIYHEETGRLLAVQETCDDRLYRERSERLVERVLPDGSRVLVEASIDPAKLMNFEHKAYSSYVVDLICEKIVGGMSLTQICLLPGFPTYAELCRWKKIAPDIQAQLDEARRDRAEQMRDQLYTHVQNVDEHNYDSTKVKIDGLKYLAGVDDKQRYGSAKADVQITQPIQIVVNTGIVRTPKDVGEST